MNTDYVNFVNEKQINLVDVGFSLGIWFFALLYYMVVAIEIYLYLTNEKNIVYQGRNKTPSFRAGIHIKTKGFVNLVSNPLPT